MRKLLLTLAAGALGLVLTGTADAHGGYGRHGHAVAAHHHGHAVRFRGGYYYPGRDHPHWARRVWNARLSRFEYFDPGLNISFYWYAPGNCYYPVTYCP